MELDEAMKILNECTREELRDHAFGDTEIFWVKADDDENDPDNEDDEGVGGGYFGSGSATVWIGDHSFKGEDARKLRECGTLGHIERNDETGPDTYTEGEVMPGLSKGDVFHELTGSYLDES